MGRLEKAFNVIRRKDFLPEEYKNYADFDMALPIGYSQTISQPYTVNLMLQWLEPQPGDKVLDVGSGSGWTTALLSYLVGSSGQVEATELIPELLEFGKNNAKKADIKNARFHPAGKILGWPKSAPYDAILVSAAAQNISQDLIDQLKIGGKMVLPVNEDILEVTKESKDNITIKKHSGFVFVPLIQP